MKEKPELSRTVVHVDSKMEASGDKPAAPVSAIEFLLRLNGYFDLGAEVTVDGDGIGVTGRDYAPAPFEGREDSYIEHTFHVAHNYDAGDAFAPQGEGGEVMASEVLCLYLADDESRLDALKQAIESHDSPELVRVQPFNIGEPGGLWIRDNLVRADELEKAKRESRYYRDDRSTFQWMWSPDENARAK